MSNSESHKLPRIFFISAKPKSAHRSHWSFGMPSGKSLQGPAWLMPLTPNPYAVLLALSFQSLMLLKAPVASLDPVRNSLDTKVPEHRG